MFNTYKQNANLREAAGALAADMKLAKQRAVRENVNYTITFNITNKSYEIQGPSGCTTNCTYDVTKQLCIFGNTNPKACNGTVKILNQNYGAGNSGSRIFQLAAHVIMGWPLMGWG